MSTILRRFGIVVAFSAVFAALMLSVLHAFRRGIVPIPIGPLGEAEALVLVSALLVALFVPLVALLLSAAGKAGARPAPGIGPKPGRDEVTGLPDRGVFLDRLRTSVEKAQEKDRQIAVLLVGIDRFRSVNDVWGQAAGNRVLVEAAGRLAALVPANGLLARLGSDEFGIVVEGDANPRSVRYLAGRIVEEMGSPYLAQECDIALSASCGVALFPVNADGADALFRAADLALGRAKSDGRQCFRFFDTEMERQLKSRTKLEADLRRALENDEFVVFYQPQMDLKTGDLIGYEALVRWERPGEGIVAPGAFIPVAEETGLIRPLGEWILRRACADAARWIEAGTVAVNFSAVQFRYPGVEQAIEMALAESGLDPARLEIEITESVFLDHSPEIMATLRRIKALGVRIAMDDFGTGYSSLSYLTRFPFDKIKIDRSFVSQLAEDDSIGAIIASIVGLGRSLSVDITAEGVETREQVTLLQAAGCSIVQGFLFGAPQRATQTFQGPAARIA